MAGSSTFHPYGQKNAKRLTDTFFSVLLVCPTTTSSGNLKAAFPDVPGVQVVGKKSVASCKISLIERCTLLTVNSNTTKPYSEYSTMYMLNSPSDILRTKVGHLRCKLGLLHRMYLTTTAALYYTQQQLTEFVQKNNTLFNITV